MTAYDIMDRECAVIATETYSYDVAHNPVAVSHVLKDGTQDTILYEYDLHHNVIREAHETHEYRYSYDLLERLTVSALGSIITEYTYDSMNRLLYISSTDGSSALYAYDTDGNVVSIVSSEAYSEEALRESEENQTGTPSPTAEATPTTEATGTPSPTATLTPTKKPTATPRPTRTPWWPWFGFLGDTGEPGGADVGIHDPAPSVPVGTMSFDDPVPAGTMSNENSEHTDIMSYDIPVHNRYYNNNGQPIGKSDGPLPKGYTNIATK